MVIVRRTARGWRVLVLRAFRNWDFPKGRIEPGESALDAARREALEETGHDDLSLDWGQAYVETPPYNRGKVARFYLARTAQPGIVLGTNAELHRPEHHEYRWLELAVARQLLVPRLQAVLDWATKRLEQDQDETGQDATP